MTDISTIVAKPRDIEIKHPATREPIGLTITLLPSTSDPVVAAKRRILDESLQRISQPSAARMEQNSLALLEASVAGWAWKGDLTFHGQKPDFTPANLRKVVTELPWVRDQIDAEAGKDAAFFATSANA